MSSVSLLPLVIIVVAFWFLLLRPQQKRQAQLRALQSELSVGDEVVLSSGFFGTVTGTTDDAVLVEIAEGVVVRVARGAIGRVLPKDETTGEPTDGTTDDIVDAPHVEPIESTDSADHSTREED